MGFIIFLGFYIIIIHTPNFIFSISHFHFQIAATQFYCSHTLFHFHYYNNNHYNSNLHEEEKTLPFSSPPSLHFPPHPQILSCFFLVFVFICVFLFLFVPTVGSLVFSICTLVAKTYSHECYRSKFLIPRFSHISKHRFIIISWVLNIFGYEIEE
ncbi:hypothetical protein MtrunA17_Chr3g0140341 [Medicago truncatula]|uniref:Transmembrane protein n=1 Tax=Medicago truncatula TaxID=3880 RepID=A0A396J377_MEDTR|nr:hypothetical protein MtrunA17_Chr3g0140341 [Medicago truncatula]